MNPGKFTTNIPSPQESIDPQETAFATSRNATTSKEPGVEESEETYVQSKLLINQRTSPNEKKVLGFPWNVAHNQLFFNLKSISHTALRLDPTNRNVGSLIGKIYDLLGFLSPVIIRVKVLMEESCNAKLGWDQPLQSEILSNGVNM